MTRMNPQTVVHDVFLLLASHPSYITQILSHGRIKDQFWNNLMIIPDLLSDRT